MNKDFETSLDIFLFNLTLQSDHVKIEKIDNGDHINGYVFAIEIVGKTKKISINQFTGDIFLQRLGLWAYMGNIYNSEVFYIYRKFLRK